MYGVGCVVVWCLPRDPPVTMPNFPSRGRDILWYAFLVKVKDRPVDVEYVCTLGI
jgi:hypothetical protein